MKIFKVVIITALICAIIKAFNVFENAGELDPNANPIAFGFLVGFFILLIFLIIFSGNRKNEKNTTKPMATPKYQYLKRR